MFHNALSEGVVIDDILKYARMNKELARVDEDSLDSSSELKKLVEAQAAELELLKQRVREGNGRVEGGGGVERGSERERRGEAVGAGRVRASVLVCLLE